MNDEGLAVQRDGIASDHCAAAVEVPQDGSVSGEHDTPESLSPLPLLSRVLERANRQRARKQVRQNQGLPKH